MSEIVIYQSATGFTKQYADWIAETLACRAVSIREMTATDIAENDTVIFGGWIMGSVIMGYDKVKKMGARKLIVFAVGASPDTTEVRESIAAANELTETPFFYMPGGLRFDKLHFFKRFILKQVKRSIAKKAEKTEQDRYMEQALGTNYDITDRDYTQELVKFVEETDAGGDRTAADKDAP